MAAVGQNIVLEPGQRNVNQDQENNNNNNNERRFNRHRHRQLDPNNLGQGEGGRDEILQLSSLNEIDFEEDENGNSFEARLYKHIFDFHTVDIGKWCIAPMIGGWLLLFLPEVWNINGFDVIRHGIPLLLVCLAIVAILLKDDIPFYHPFRTLEMRSFQLFTIIMVSMLVDVCIDVVGPGLGFFHFDVFRKEKLVNQIEIARQIGFFSFMRLTTWITVNFQFFMISFVGLLIVETCRSVWIMYRANSVIAEILTYECFAYAKPYIALVSYLLIINEISKNLHPAMQSIYVWALLLGGLVAWIILIFRYMWNYSEIGIPRPVGIQGYEYMEWVSMFQISASLTLHVILCLSRDIYFHTAPGAFINSLRQPGLLLGPPLYLDQIWKNKPVDEWNRKRLFEPNFDSFQGLFFFINIARYIKLKVEVNAIRERMLLHHDEDEFDDEDSDDDED